MPSDTQWNVALQERDKKLIARARGNRDLSNAETIRLALNLLLVVEAEAKKGNGVAIVDESEKVVTRLLVLK